jgi:hypothetical protein
MNESGLANIGWMSFAAGFAGALALIIFLRWRRRSRAATLDLGPRPAPPALAPDVRAQVRRLKADGRAIDAIKLVRSRTGCDLKAAKDAVDALR